MPSNEPEISPPAPTTTPLPTPGPGPSNGPAIASLIVPGAVDRTSLELTATYRVNAAITVRTGALDVSSRIEVTNTSGAGIDRLELNTIAARLGGISIVAATVDNNPVVPTITDQTIVVPLGGTLPNGASANVRIEYRATLRKDVSDADWMFSRSGGTLTLYRWIPWISQATPFDRPNNGEPFVTASSPQVDVEILTDEPMILAAPSDQLQEFDAGTGSAWTFTVRFVRDVSLVLAPDFRVARATSGNVAIEAFTRPGGLSAPQLVHLAQSAIARESQRIGLPFPATSLAIVETPGGVGLESPGLLWIPRRLDSLNRTYAVYQGVAHHWFYGLVGSDQRAEPFADEAPADLLARTAMGRIRASNCAKAPLDRSIARYSRSCYYEVVFVQGGLLLDGVRKRMGTTAFWTALRAYVSAYANGIGGTGELLEALQAGTTVDLRPLLRSRFPSLY